MGTIDFDNRDSDSIANKIYNVVQYIVIVYNVLEAILKIISKGFSHEQNSYLKEPFNWIDLFVAISGILEFTESLRYFTILRLPRAIMYLQHFKFFKSINDMTAVI